MTNPYVFISYSRQDRQFVDRLSGELNRAGVETWTDTQNIGAGENWQEELESGLLGAAVLIYVASAKASTSGWVQMELQAYSERAGWIIPVIIDDAGPTSIPDFLRDRQWVDFRPNFEGAFQKLLQGIRGIRRASPVKQQSRKSKGYAFISYASEDIDFVLDLKQYLAKRGYSYWDFQSSKRNYQIDYTLELEEKISNAEATLSVVSPEWKKSRTALQELHYSKEVNTPVFLLLLRNPGPTLALAGLTFIDFSESRDSGFTTLGEEMDGVGL